MGFVDDRRSTFTNHPQNGSSSSLLVYPRVSTLTSAARVSLVTAAAHPFASLHRSLWHTASVALRAEADFASHCNEFTLRVSCGLITR